MAATVKQNPLTLWDYETHHAATQREREQRWSAPCRARVVHPKYGCVVVPHCSNYAAVLNAAEYWGCDWAEIINAEVWWAGPEDGPAVTMPEIYRNVDERWKIGAYASAQ